MRIYAFINHHIRTLHVFQNILYCIKYLVQSRCTQTHSLSASRKVHTNIRWNSIWRLTLNYFQTFGQVVSSEIQFTDLHF